MSVRDRPAGEGLEGHGRDELLGDSVMTTDDAGAGLHQLGDEVGDLVGGDAAADGDDDLLALECREVGGRGGHRGEEVKE